jgi:hypothetical protein
MAACINCKVEKDLVVGLSKCQKHQYAVNILFSPPNNNGYLQFLAARQVLIREEGVPRNDVQSMMPCGVSPYLLSGNVLLVEFKSTFTCPALTLEPPRVCGTTLSSKWKSKGINQFASRMWSFLAQINFRWTCNIQCMYHVLLITLTVDNRLPSQLVR